MVFPLHKKILPDPLIPLYKKLVNPACFINKTRLRDGEVEILGRGGFLVVGT